MQIRLPRGMARFNRVVTNPIQGIYAWALPPWAVVCHRGRRSGRTYRTPVIAVRRGRTIAIAVLYGENSDWVRNVLAAGGGEVVRGGRTHELSAPRLVNRQDPDLPAPARLLARPSGTALIGTLGEPRPGFGRGPRA